jgi:hypothetical protein
MITCVVDYVIDPKKIDVFEQFAKRWIDLVNRYGGRHHGYFLPSEGAIAHWRFLAFQAWRTTKPIDATLASTRSLSRQIAFEMRAVVFLDMTACSCGPCSRANSTKRRQLPEPASCRGARAAPSTQECDDGNIKKINALQLLSVHKNPNIEVTPY